jgi:MSHA biogenesis protein MshM
MPIETLEEIRLLSNLETQDEKLLQIVMFGQPELDETLATPRIRQLKERITYSFYLPPFTAHEVAEYLTTRLRACGYQGMGLFTRAAVRRLTRSSRGLLRRINLLADKALLAAYAANAVKVTAGHVRLASRDSEFGSGLSRVGRLIGIVACIVLALGGALWWAGGVLLGEGRGASFATQARIGDAPLVARVSEGATTFDSLAGRSPSSAPAPVPVQPLSAERVPEPASPFGAARKAGAAENGGWPIK